MQNDNLLIRHPNFEGVYTYGLSDEIPDWSDANCKGIDTDFFDYPNGEDGADRFLERMGGGATGISSVYSYLQRVCAHCPVLTECFTYALQNEEYGYWGGTAPRQRERMRNDIGIELRESFDSDKFDEYIITERVIANSLLEQEDYEWS